MAQRPGWPRSGQETTRPVPDQPPIQPNRQINRQPNRQAGRQTNHQPDRLSTGQSARLARREAIRAQRQAARRAGQQTGPGAPRTAKAKPPDARASRPLAFKSPAAKSPKSLAAKPHPQVPSSTAVHPFRPKQSLWLTLLVWLQRGSGVVTLMLVVGALITYGWTVYTQEQWGKQFDKLESLKKKERQLVSANEVLKNQMAEQAERPTAGLLLPDPSNAIFLAPAPQRPAVKPRPVAPGAKPDPIRVLGY